jgi:hypothetical protein
MPPEEPPKTAALTSRTAVVATLLLAGGIAIMAIAMRGCEAADEEAAVPSPVSGAAVLPEGSLAPPGDHAARLLLRVELTG